MEEKKRFEEEQKRKEEEERKRKEREAEVVPESWEDDVEGEDGEGQVRDGDDGKMAEDGDGESGAVGSENGVPEQASSSWISSSSFSSCLLLQESG